MKPVALILFALLSASGQSRRAILPPAAQQPAAEAVKPEDRGTIEGTITSATGEPLKKVNITARRNDAGLSPGMSYSAVTDAEGHFVIADVDPGKYRVDAERTGYVRLQYGAKTASSPGTVLTLAKAQKMKGIDLKLTPQAVITGRVLDEDGDPLQNVGIQIMRLVYSRGKKQWAPMNGSNTNDLGEYRLFGLAAGRYILSANYRQGNFVEASKGAARDTYAPTYYPNSPSPDSAARIDVTPGAQIRGMDIRLQKTKTVQISGRITGGSDGPGRTMIMLLPKTEGVMNYTSRSMSATYNEAGDFIVNNVTPGSYTLMAVSNGDSKQLTARMHLDVGTSPIEGITLQLGSGFEIAGRITIEGESTPNQSPGMRVLLQPKGGMMFGPSSQGGQVKEDHTFTFTNVQPDSYDVMVIGLPEGGYVRAIRFGDQQVNDSNLDLSGGGELTIVVAVSAAQVTGTVQNDQAATTATVCVVPTDGHDANFKMAPTDQNGSYTVKGVPPGEYRLYAFDNVESGSCQDPDWLKPYESKGERVTLRDNDKQTTQLKLIAVTPDN